MQFVQQLKDRNIKAIGWDFDSTALSYGSTVDFRFNATRFEKDLQKHFVRKMSADFAKVVRCAHAHGIEQGIVTFNDGMDNNIKGNRLDLSGVDLIKPILHKMFPDITIPIWAWNPYIREYKSPSGRKIQADKNWHLDALKRTFGVHLKKHVLLVDDDKHNVLQARKAGYRALFVGGKKGFQLKKRGFRKGDF